MNTKDIRDRLIDAQAENLEGYGLNFNDDDVVSFIQTLLDKAVRAERNRWLFEEVCVSCGEDIIDSKGLTDTCSECLADN